ncbi:MAG TPA: carboxypeptidase-like regulatory domain-containing protein [Puia sp.]|uniref:carboxypeptidase-like regulatory domain-containing protein n=1 Tax=Puia sp. TaxID=2045100 RepID=UPI002CE9790E|nr:carboxypeptidase-like regulatory domain-containing protein [Puia sp.]HVU95206.1 carboxypeptidase-like regulatory domain-containing protein [Puia sp.]
MTLFRLSLGCLILFALSCQKKNIPGPAGPQGPAGANGADNLQKGPLQGTVILYDTLGKPLADNSGATITLENTNPLVQATSAADGSFTIVANEGYYNLSIQKQGFGTMRYLRILNTGTPTPTKLGAISASQLMPSGYDIKSLKIDSSIQFGQPYLNFTAFLANPRHLGSDLLIIYMNDSTGVASGHNKFAWIDTWTQINDSILTYASYPWELAQLSGKFTNTSNLYFSVAIINPAFNIYVDEQGNSVASSAAKASPEVIVNNAQHKF